MVIPHLMDNKNVSLDRTPGKTTKFPQISFSCDTLNKSLQKLSHAVTSLEQESKPAM